MSTGPRANSFLRFRDFLSGGESHKVGKEYEREKLWMYFAKFLLRNRDILPRKAESKIETGAGGRQHSWS